MADPNADLPIPTLRISESLTRVAGVLRDMENRKGELQAMSPGIPPAAFGAGSPMRVLGFESCRHRSGLLTIGCVVCCRLKQFDESTVTSRKGSQAATPPVAVKGIGGKGKGSYLSGVIVVGVLILCYVDSCEA